MRWGKTGTSAYSTIAITAQTMAAYWSVCKCRLPTRPRSKPSWIIWVIHIGTKAKTRLMRYSWVNAANMVANYNHNQQWHMGIESQASVTANVFLMQGLRMVFADIDLK